MDLSSVYRKHPLRVDFCRPARVWHSEERITLKGVEGPTGRPYSTAYEGGNLKNVLDLIPFGNLKNVLDLISFGNRKSTRDPLATLYTYRMCLVQIYGHAGTNLGRAAGRNLPGVRRQYVVSGVFEGPYRGTSLIRNLGRQLRGASLIRNLCR